MQILENITILADGTLMPTNLTKPVLIINDPLPAEKQRIKK